MLEANINRPTAGLKLDCLLPALPDQYDLKNESDWNWHVYWVRTAFSNFRITAAQKIGIFIRDVRYQNDC